MYCMCSNYKVDLLIYSFYSDLFIHMVISILLLFNIFDQFYEVKGAVLYYSFFSSTCFLSVSTPCCMVYSLLLHVVAQSLKPVKRLATCKRAQQLLTLLGVLGVVASACT